MCRHAFSLGTSTELATMRASAQAIGHTSGHLVCLKLLNQNDVEGTIQTKGGTYVTIGELQVLEDHRPHQVCNVEQLELHPKEKWGQVKLLLLAAT